MDLQPPSVHDTKGLSTSLNDIALPKYREEDDLDTSIASSSSPTDDSENGYISSTPETSVIDESFPTPIPGPYGRKDGSASPDVENTLDEDPSQWIFDPDHPPEDVEYIDGKMVGGTLAAIVEKLTPPDGVVEPAFLSKFFLTFRLFSSPLELAKSIKARYNLAPPPNISEVEEFLWQEQKGSSVRLETLRLVLTWLERYWRPQVDVTAFYVLDSLAKSCLRENLSPDPTTYMLVKMINNQLRHKRTASLPSPDSVPADIDNSVTPKRRITRELLTFLRRKEYSKFCVMDFDSLELARQLTLMGSAHLRAINCQSSQNLFVNFRAIESFSSSITHWVSGSILHELKIERRTWLVKFFIKIAMSCFELRNFNVSRAVLSALKSPSIAGLGLTMSNLSQETQSQLKYLVESQDFDTLFELHHSGIITPSVPYLERYISTWDNLPPYRPSQSKDKKLINLERYTLLAEFCQDLPKWQIPYNLKAIPELQTYLQEVAFKTSPHLNRPVAHPMVVPNKRQEHWSFKPQKPRAPAPRQSVSTVTTYTSSAATIYSHAASSIASSDYGLFYTRRAFSQDSISTHEWWENSSN